MAVAVDALRRYVVAHQGYASRFRRAGDDDVAAEVRRLQAVQLDSIATVDRAHRLTLASRIGAYDEAGVSRLLARRPDLRVLGARGVPASRSTTTRSSSGGWSTSATATGGAASARPRGGTVERRVLARIGEEGALPVRAFEGRSGPMWGWKPEKRALEHLFAAGELAIAGRQGFQRVYDLPERVIPREALEAPTPSRGGVPARLRAPRGRGPRRAHRVAESPSTAASAAARRRCARTSTRLVAEGLVRRVEVDDGGPPVVVPADAELDGAPSGAVLLCPFDNLMWDRPFVTRLFGFDHVIEVYKREHERVYGYYVLPLLLDDRLVGRADLKSDRARERAADPKVHARAEVRRRLDEPLERAATRLARALGLERVTRDA